MLQSPQLAARTDQLQMACVCHRLPTRRSQQHSSVCSSQSGALLAALLGSRTEPCVLAANDIENIELFQWQPESQVRPARQLLSNCSQLHIPRSLPCREEGTMMLSQAMPLHKVRMYSLVISSDSQLHA